MNTMQRRALDAPCYLGCECLHPRFGHSKGRYHIVLTVNAGYE